jgi:hypothetical protein
MNTASIAIIKTLQFVTAANLTKLYGYAVIQIAQYNLRESSTMSFEAIKTSRGLSKDVNFQIQQRFSLTNVFFELNCTG